MGSSGVSGTDILTLQATVASFLESKGHSTPALSTNAQHPNFVHFNFPKKNAVDRSCPFGRRVHQSNTVSYTLNAAYKVRLHAVAAG
jgi:hypothetical protein